MSPDFATKVECPVPAFLYYYCLNPCDSGKDVMWSLRPSAGGSSEATA
jgi:hypothetical protein